MFLDLLKIRGLECDWQFDWLGKHLNSTSGAAQAGTGGGAGGNTTAVSSQPRAAGTGGLGNDGGGLGNNAKDLGMQQAHLGNNLGGGAANKNFINNRDKVRVFLFIFKFSIFVNICFIIQLYYHHYLLKNLVTEGFGCFRLFKINNLIY